MENPSVRNGWWLGVPLWRAGNLQMMRDIFGRPSIGGSNFGTVWPTIPTSSNRLRNNSNRTCFVPIPYHFTIILPMFMNYHMKSKYQIGKFPVSQHFQLSNLTTKNIKTSIAKSSIPIVNGTIISDDNHVDISESFLDAQWSIMIFTKASEITLWLVVWNIFYFPIYWE